MSFVTVGSITVNINPLASADPVVTHPANAAATYAAFPENIVSNGLAKTIFDAYPAVANRNNPSLAKVKWPPGYANITPPYGRPYDPVSGYREVKCEDALPDVKRWTQAVNAAANGRKGGLDTYAEDAVAIATGIDAALTQVFRVGVTTLASGVSPSIAVANLASSSRIFVTRRNPNGTVGDLSAPSADRSNGVSGTFLIRSASASDNSSVEWMVIG